MVVNVTGKAKCVVVLSGGPDSSTVAYWAKSQEYDVYALTFKYGQIAEKETDCARKIALELTVPHKIIDLSSLKTIFGGVTSLCDEAITMTSGFSETIIVPFRNAIFLSVAVAYAVSIGADRILYGAQGSDEQFYPDCRKEFYKAFEKAAQLGTCRPISIEAPFSNMRKSELLRIGAELGVPLQNTWSCYRDGATHCGKCESCVNRRNAFRESGVFDPTEYAE
jgi:7-cyano-7-deazaguanine synthase